jgi:hypothetical protein
MTPTQAGAYAHRLRVLLRAGEITHHQYALADCLLWSCRRPGAAQTSVSYSRLSRLAHLARATVAAGLRRLEALGLLRKTKRRLRVRWALGVASRQATNLYELIVQPGTEFTPRPVLREQENPSLPTVVTRPPDHPLEIALRRLQDRLLTRRSVVITTSAHNHT